MKNVAGCCRLAVTQRVIIPIFMPEAKLPY